MKRKAWNSSLPAARKPMNRGKGLRRVSRKRAKAMRETIPAHGPCEIRTLLAGVIAWERCKRDLGGEWETYERHHVFRMRHLLDDERFVLNLCKPSHKFIHEVWGTAGLVVCMVALKRAGRLDVEAVAAEQKCPLFRVREWLSSGAFASEPVLIRFCEELLGESR